MNLAFLKNSKSSLLFRHLWREIGLTLLTVSLLFLPWFRDPYPPVGRPSQVTGIEFITRGTWLVVLAYLLVLAAYIYSKLLTPKWPGIIPFLTGCVLFLHLFLATSYTRFNPPGIPLDRWNNLSDKHFSLLIGSWFNLIGLLLLFIGFYIVETGRGRTAVLLGPIGTVIGIILAFLMHEIGFWLPEPQNVLSIQFFSYPVIMTTIGSWLGFRLKHSP